MPVSFIYTSGLRTKVLLLSLFFFPALGALTVSAQQDYTQYHLGIIAAENEIFLKGKPAAGLELFKKTFDKYDFAYVDDCIEAFQLALHFEQEAYAMQFIKKALDNGFELKFLDRLSPACPCTYYKDYATKVCVQNSFMEKHREALEAYADKVYPKYLERIDQDLLDKILKRHVTEQIYKNYIPGIIQGVDTRHSQKIHKETYLAVNKENISFIDSLAQHNIFLGEQNLGIYTDKLVAGLNLPIEDVRLYTKSILKKKGVAPDTKVPVISEGEYFDKGALYIIFFHNTPSFDHLSKYKDEAIKQGYLHPREYASLKYSRTSTPTEENIYLQPRNKPAVNDRKYVNKIRKEMLLPSYELDSAKHAFAHQHDLHLFFGFFSGTR